MAARGVNHMDNYLCWVETKGLPYYLSFPGTLISLDGITTIYALNRLWVMYRCHKWKHRHVNTKMYERLEQLVEPILVWSITYSDFEDYMGIYLWPISSNILDWTISDSDFCLDIVIESDKIFTNTYESYRIPTVHHEYKKWFHCITPHKHTTFTFPQIVFQNMDRSIYAL